MGARVRFGWLQTVVTSCTATTPGVRYRFGLATGPVVAGALSTLLESAGGEALGAGWALEKYRADGSEEPDELPPQPVTTREMTPRRATTTALRMPSALTGDVGQTRLRAGGCVVTGQERPQRPSLQVEAV